MVEKYLKISCQCDEECGGETVVWDIWKFVSDKILPHNERIQLRSVRLPFPKILKSIDTFKSLQNFTRLSCGTGLKNWQLKGSQMSSTLSERKLWKVNFRGILFAFEQKSCHIFKRILLFIDLNAIFIFKVFVYSGSYRKLTRVW